MKTLRMPLIGRQTPFYKKAAKFKEGQPQTRTNHHDH
jgi:hypothetical protein